jgi:hypothetical protein
MKHMKLIAGILVFGSLWGFSEVIIGSGLKDTGLPSGAIMTGIFAMMFLVFSRIMYQKPGMQLAMGLVAGGLRWFNPFVGCHICSAIAIVGEALLFELIWYKIKDVNLLKTITLQSSMCIFSTYCIYVGGYIITQILTPLSVGQFYLNNLLVLLPEIFASGLLAALLGAAIVPIAVSITSLDISLEDRLYYPATVGISLLCWSTVVIIWFTFGA